MPIAATIPITIADARYFAASTQNRVTAPPITVITPSPSVPFTLISPNAIRTVTHGPSDPTITTAAPTRATMRRLSVEGRGDPGAVVRAADDFGAR